jgi:hypothetical protein
MNVSFAAEAYAAAMILQLSMRLRGARRGGRAAGSSRLGL